MPVFEWDLDLQASEWDWREAAGPLPDMYDVSEDFWRKFEELPDLGDDLESLLESTVCNSDPSNVLRHHDCMWAGMCLSKEHKNLVVGTLPPPPPPPPPPPAPVLREPTVTTTTTTTTNNTVSKSNVTEKPKREPRRKGVIVQKTVGRSLLISSRTRMPEPTRPETPPSLSESEEDDKKTVPVVPVSEVTNQVSVRRQMQQMQQQPLHQPTNLNVQFDHNYDKSVRLDDLGVQTPSDSEEEEEEEEEEEDEEEEDADEEEEEEDADEEEDCEEGTGDDSEEEEIDVVSLNNTTGTVRMRNQPNRLPYNPSRELRRELQDTVASAITTNKLLTASRTVNRRLNNGPGRRKRKRADSDEEDDSNTLMQQQQQQQQALLNNRVMPSNGSLSGSTYNPTTTPRYYHPHHRRTWRQTTVTSTSTSTTKKSRFSTDSETDSEKRSLHNNMERMRRIGLRNAFEDLRVLIPSLKESKRAAKVNILKDSAVYVRHLTVQERSLAQKVMSLHHEQEKLRTRLSKLRRSLAAHR